MLVYETIYAHQVWAMHCCKTGTRKGCLGCLWRGVVWVSATVLLSRTSDGCAYCQCCELLCCIHHQLIHSTIAFMHHAS
jgi:hypothetical protein